MDTTQGNVMTPKPYILVVEDEKFLCELIEKKLDSASLDARCYYDAESALLALEQEKPRLILLDILLPGIDGFEFLRRVKGDDRFKDIPVMIMSNLGDRADIEKAMKLGAVEYIVKTNHSLDEVVEMTKKRLV